MVNVFFLKTRYNKLMTHAFKKIFASFLERPDVWFFCGFLITFTLSIRKVLFFYPINGTFNEYTGIYLYLSDIFLFLTIATWLFILCNKYSILSTFKLFALKCSTWNILLKNYIQNVPRLPRSNKMFHVEHFVYFWSGTFLCLKKVYKQVINNYTIIFPLLLAIFSFLSILWASNQSVAFFRSIKLLEFILLYFYIIYNVPRSPRTNEQSLRVEAGGTFLAKAEDKKGLTLAPCSENVPRGTFSESTGWNIFSGFLIIIIISGFIQSIIGFVQFFTNQSAGLFWLRESVLSPEISGVAKIIFDGASQIRAYGLFPHPNIFGGFLVISIISSLLYLKMFHACPVATKCSTWNILFASGVEHSNENSTNKLSVLEHLFKIVPRGTILRAFIIIQVFALLLTFSKSAIIGLFIGFLSIVANNTLFNIPPASTREGRLSTRGGRGTIFDKLYRSFHACPVAEKCSTWNISLASGMEHFWKKIILLFSIITLLFFIIKPDIGSLFLKSLNERSFYLNVSRGTFAENPFFGIGAGQFVPNLQNVRNLEMWQFQPVHNVFLLILNECGIFILFAFLFFLYKMFHVEHYTGHAWNIVLSKRSAFDNLNIESLLRMVLLAFIFIMFFDHYLWDIQQGQTMLWAILGLIVASRRKQLFGEL